MRLPNRQGTDDVDYFSKVWDEIARPIEELTDWKLYSFDPDLAFYKPVGTEQVSVEFALYLYPVLTGQEFPYPEAVNLPLTKEEKKEQAKRLLEEVEGLRAMGQDHFADFQERRIERQFMKPIKQLREELYES